MCQGRSAGAHLETGKAPHSDAGVVQQGLHALLAVLHRRLLEKRDVLEEPVDAALDDPGKSLLGLSLLAFL